MKKDKPVANRGFWYISLSNVNCPHYNSEDGSCGYPNKMYRPPQCCEYACPIKENTYYTD